MRKLVTALASTIVGLTLLSCFGYAVLLAVQGSAALGPLAEPLAAFATFPRTVKEVLTSDELKGVPPTYLPREDGTQDQDPTLNRLDYDLFALLAFYNRDRDRWDIDLRNLRTDSLLHQWRFTSDQFAGDAYYNFDDSRPKHSLLLPDKSLVMALRETRTLVRLDSASNVVWTNDDFRFHHSLELDADGALWVCAAVPSDALLFGDPLNFTAANLLGGRHAFRDDLLAKVDLETGETLFAKSIAQIFFEHDQAGRLFGTGFPGHDPIHLNDIQPAPADSPFWNEGDLFVSIRNRSIVFQYRPATDELLAVLSGPFVHQHDVDFLSDHELSIFNNNWPDFRRGGQTPDASEPDARLGASEIVVYDFRTQSYRRRYARVFEEHALYTPTGGLHTPLSNGDLFVDLEDVGRILVVDSTGIVYRRIFPADIDSYKHLTSWTRVYETLPFD